MPRKAKKSEGPSVAPAEDQAPPNAESRSGVSDSADPQEGAAPDVIGLAVTFLLDAQLYGLPIEAVQEIQQLVEFTPMPDAAPALVGLIDLRGTVVPAIDLRVLVGIEARPFTLETPMIFCRVRGHVVSLIVDGVEDVVELPANGLQPPSGLYSLADRMLGTYRLPRGLVLLLDIERLVPDAALAAADSVGGA